MILIGSETQFSCHQLWIAMGYGRLQRSSCGAVTAMDLRPGKTVASGPTVSTSVDPNGTAMDSENLCHRIQKTKT
jgi:hypothetical protein